MPRILRSPGSKSFRLENVSVPNAGGEIASGGGIRGGLRRSPPWVKLPHGAKTASCLFLLR
jgi:hypothetical protein